MEKEESKKEINRTKGKEVLIGEFIQGKENIERINSDWDNLFMRAKDAPATFSRAWIQTFINYDSYKGQPCLIVVWKGDELVSLLPILIQNHYGIRIAKLISTNLATYLGLLLDPNYPEAVHVVAETWIKKKITNIFSDKHVYYRDKGIRNFINEISRQGFRYNYGYERICHEIELESSFDEYIKKNTTGKRIRKLKYTERQLYNSGNIDITRYSGNDITPEILKRISQIQEESWMKQRDASVLKQPFYQKLLMNMSEAGFGSIWIMKIDGDDAAFAFASIAHDTISYQYTAFKLKYESSLSVGKVLLMQIIRDSCKDNIKYFDFGQGDGGYKRFWANKSHHVYWVVAGKGVFGYITILCYRIAWRLAKNKKVFSLYRRIKRKLNSL